MATVGLMPVAGCVLTLKSDFGWPPASKRRASTSARRLPELAHTTTNRPDSAAATDARYWKPAVYVFTANSGPSGLPATSSRRPEHAAVVVEPPSVLQTTTKPLGVAATDGS